MYTIVYRRSSIHKIEDRAQLGVEILKTLKESLDKCGIEISSKTTKGFISITYKPVVKKQKTLLSSSPN